MKTTQTKSFFWTQLLTTALLGALLGILLIVLSVSFLLKVIFVVMGIMTILSAIPMLAFGLSNLSDRAGRMSFAFSLLSILMGIVMIFWHSDILLIIVGVYFLIFPIVEILAARDRAARAKRDDAPTKAQGRCARRHRQRHRLGDRYRDLYRSRYLRVWWARSRHRGCR